MSSSLWTTEADYCLTFCLSVTFLYSVIFCFFDCDFLQKYAKFAAESYISIMFLYSVFCLLPCKSPNFIRTK